LPAIASIARDSASATSTAQTSWLLFLNYLDGLAQNRVPERQLYSQCTMASVASPLTGSAEAFYRKHDLGKSFDSFAPMRPLVSTRTSRIE
jgi:hypothetical protein